MPGSAEKLRELACWYREFAERTDNPTIWEARLRTADDLDAEAIRVDRAYQRKVPKQSTAIAPRLRLTERGQLQADAAEIKLPKS
jgi:hypothetical protein